MAFEEWAALTTSHPNLRRIELELAGIGIKGVTRCQIQTPPWVGSLVDLEDHSGMWLRRVSKADSVSSLAHGCHRVQDDNECECLVSGNVQSGFRYEHMRVFFESHRRSGPDGVGDERRRDCGSTCKIQRVRSVPFGAVLPQQNFSVRVEGIGGIPRQQPVQ